MLPAVWYPVLSSKDLKPGRPLGVQRLGERHVFWRDAQGQVASAFDRCPHRGVALSRGQVRRDGCIQCPYHGFAFNPAGDCVSMPVNGPDARIPKGFELHARPVTEAHGLIWLWSGEPREAYPEPPWFEEMAEPYHAEVQDTWPLNHVRLTESFFDVHHFRWVHGSTFPGAGEMIDEFELEVDEEAGHILTRGTLRHADKPGGLPWRVEMRFPNLVLLVLTPKVKGVAFATPISETESWVYIRYQQEYLSLPLLSPLIAWLTCQLELRLVQRRQDLPLMLTQEPKLPTPGCDRLVRADAGTAAYLRLRARRLRAKENAHPAEAS
ncbi:MAG: aromatic ring-hydroxylating dioxygenase subunit alpha [Alphaproteobacteria bacterium]|nr:aromatic ring-hydroxylating dioxygenase subunit alpha [Alphaproteobacteria bacterium]